MPYYEGKFWIDERNGVYSNKGTFFKPPPNGDPIEPPPPMGADQEAIDAWDRKDNYIRGVKSCHTIL